MSKNTIKEFLEEYRALCVKHGYLIVMDRDEQTVIGQLAETEIILTQLKSGALDFITIDGLCNLATNTNDTPYILLPRLDEIEWAVQKKEAKFRAQVQIQMDKINKKQLK